MGKDYVILEKVLTPYCDKLGEIGIRNTQGVNVTKYESLRPPLG